MATNDDTQSHSSRTEDDAEPLDHNDPADKNIEEEETMEHSGHRQITEENAATPTESDTNPNTDASHNENREDQQDDTTVQTQANESTETSADMDTDDEDDHRSGKTDNVPTSTNQDTEIDDSGPIAGVPNSGEQDDRNENDSEPDETPLAPRADEPVGPNTDSAEKKTSGQVQTVKAWLDLQFHGNSEKVKKPDELEPMDEPRGPIDEEILNRIQGSMIGMALGDALGAHVEFRPHDYLVSHPVTDLGEGGTWGLSKGQFTDDTSMALCLANSLIVNCGFNAYDQLVRYKWWNKYGYMSSTGQCFDIGAATKQSIDEFHRRQNKFCREQNISKEHIDSLSDPELLQNFPVYCSEQGVAGNGALMRLAPVPLFFYRNPAVAVEYSGVSGQITHGDTKAYDACRYYGALIVAALQGQRKKDLLNDGFYEKHKSWFGEKDLHQDIKSIAKGSYKNEKGYDGGIRGKGYIVSALEAALWAFWFTDNFEDGALAAVNLGDDTDTTAAIYGQLAGAHYGYDELPKKWTRHVYAKDFMKMLSKWITYEGEQWSNRQRTHTSES